jgi:hypothetical protein
MSYYERYLKGDHRRVISELSRLDTMSEDTLAEAVAVAEVAMERVAYNCELIAHRLAARGYAFSVYCDANDDGGEQPPIVPFNSISAEALHRLKSMVGALPITLVAFWKRVGSVALTGTHPDFPDMLDPLVVYPVEIILEEFADLECEDDGRFHVALSPDDYHKDNISGGMPYSVALPRSGFDFRLLYEARDTDFIDYLRDVILSRGGFGALDPRSRIGVPVAELTAELLPF